jgi:hypothetical protein
LRKKEKNVKKTLMTLLALVATNILAAEGMWMPQQIPQLASELQKMGIKIDPNRFSDLTGDPMGAVVSLGGCSASFVSPDGLVVTNHHCGFGALQFNSTPQRDLITNGFLARTREEELSAGPGSRIFVTTKIEDVTNRVTGSLDSKLSDLAREKAIDRNVKQLVDECEKPAAFAAGWPHSLKVHSICEPRRWKSSAARRSAGQFPLRRRLHRRQLRLADVERQGGALRSPLRRHLRIPRLRLRRRSEHHSLDSRRLGVHALDDGRR